MNVVVEHPLATWGFGVAAVAYLAFALHLTRLGYFSKPINKPGIALLLASLCTVLWATLNALSPDAQSVWVLSVVLDILRYASWFGFVTLLFAQSAASSPGLRDAVRWMRPWSITLVAFGLLVLGATVAGGGGASPGLVHLAMMLLTVFGLVLVEQLFRGLPEDALWSAKPICLGLAGTFLFDLYLFSQAVLFRGVDPDAWSIRGAAHACVVPLLFMASTRHQNWIAKIRVSRKVVFHSTTLLLAGVYLLFIAGVGYYVRYFGGDWGRALQLALVFLALVFLSALVLSRSLRARLRVVLGKHFFRYRYDYREEWLKFTQTLSSQQRPQEMGSQVIHGLADMVESPSGALWLLQNDVQQFRQTTRWNMPSCPQTEATDSELMQFVRSTGWVVNLDELKERPALYSGLQVPPWLAALPQAWLLVPLGQGDGLVGFVVLSRSRARMDVNWEVLDLLKTAGRQAASVLMQMQATEALLEARKFEAFNRMSAFVVHDLKNIVTQLSLMVKNAKRLRDNPEFQADMLMTVENSLERMRQLMLQLRDGSASGGASVGVSLARIAKKLSDAAQARGREVVLELEPHVHARGHTERMERVIGHLVNNALDATPASGRVWIRVERYGSHARVVVGDNGAGMSEEFVRNRLFKPFSTTKTAGMGIGVYESGQYVQELGGKISVDSQEGEGTVVTVLLPLIETFETSDLTPLGDA